MSGPSVGGGGRGDPFGNIFGSGGGDKQVYPPAPPGYKYVDLNIPQAPQGYSVAKMSSIANNQSTPAPAYGVVGNAGLSSNAGLYGRGAGGRTTYRFPAHTPEGIAERAQVALADRAARANQYAELQGLAPPYPMPGQSAPGVAANQYGGGQGYRPPPSAMISGTPWATVNPGAGNTTPFHMPGDTLTPPAAGPAGAPSVLNPMVPSGGPAKSAPPFDPAKGGILTRSDGTQVLRMPGLDHDIPLKRTASGLVPVYTHEKFTPEGAAERTIFQKYIGGLNLEATTNALNPLVAAPPAVNNAPPAVNNAPPAVNNALPPAANNAPPAADASSGPSYIPDVLWKIIKGGYDAVTKDPVPQSKALGPQGAIEAPYPDLASAMRYDPLPSEQDDNEEAA